MLFDLVWMVFSKKSGPIVCIGLYIYMIQFLLFITNHYTLIVLFQTTYQELIFQRIVFLAKYLNCEFILV